MGRWMIAVCLVGIHASAAAVRAQEPPPAAPAITAAQLERALGRVSRGEPHIGAVARAAVRASAADPDEISAMATRARVAGLVPVLRGGVRRGQATDLSALQVGEDGRSTWSTDDDLSVHGTLTFRFDRLLFAREEVPLLREDRARRAERWEIVRTVVHLYYERRRLMLERELLGPDLSREVRIEELGALLDGFTAGAFSSMIGRAP